MAKRLFTVKNVGPFLARRDGGWHCHYCGCKIARDPKSLLKRPDLAPATIDHMQPLCKGGDDGVRNMVLCCKSCNEEKGETDYMTFWLVTYERREQNNRGNTYAP